MNPTAPAAETKTDAPAPAVAASRAAATPIVVPKKQPKTIKDHLQGDALKLEVARALPKHLSADRFMRVAITAITKTPKLAECDQASFFGALLTLSQFGLEPDGRRAHLIPFENRKRNVVECQLIIDWKGYVELAMRSGVVANLHADVVRTGDVLEYSAGQLARHVPHFLRNDADKPKEPGEVYAVYALANFRDGSSKCEVLSIDEVEAIRRRSRSGSNGPWVTDFNEMAKKTAFRRLSKWLPLSPEIIDLLDKDDDRLEEIAAQNAKRVGPIGDMASALGDLPAIGATSEGRDEEGGGA